jgi:predicted transcriptional regulator
MPSSAKRLRQSVTLSAGVARRVRALARVKKASASRVIAELVESGLEAQETERDRFLQLAERLAQSTDRAAQKAIKEELARLTFGD